MAKGMGPIVLLGGAAALAALAMRKKGEKAGQPGEVVASGTRYNQLNMNGEYRVLTIPLRAGFAFGPGNMGYSPEIKVPRGNWVSVAGPQDEIDEAEALAISALEEQGYVKETFG